MPHSRQAANGDDTKWGVVRMWLGMSQMAGATIAAVLLIQTGISAWSLVANREHLRFGLEPLPATGRDAPMRTPANTTGGIDCFTGLIENVTQAGAQHWSSRYDKD